MNILFVVAEELRADALGCCGNGFCPTPHLDAFALRGVRFTQHFTVHGKCVPSRVAMLHGTYPSALGCRELTTLPPAGAPNIATLLREQGYRTALIGKNHVLRVEALRESFDFAPPPGPHGQEYRVDDYDRLPPLRKALYQGRIDRPLTELRDWMSVGQFGEFLDGSAGRPFCAWLNFENAHPPYAAPAPFFGSIDRAQVPAPKRCPFEDKPSFLRNLHECWHIDGLSEHDLTEIKAVYHEQVRAVDDAFGNALLQLEQRGVLDDTLVVFTADHGDFAGEFGVVEKWDTAFQEEILHVPLIMAGPGIQSAGRSEACLVENIDILPTLLDLLGIPQPIWVQHAMPFTPVLRAEASMHRPDVLAMGGVESAGLVNLHPLSQPSPHAYTGKHRALHRDPASLAPARMLRTDRHKLVLRGDGRHELYDLAEQPRECVNRYGEPALATLQRELTERLCLRLMEAEPRLPALPATGLMA